MIRRVANDLGATLSIAFVNNGAEFVTVSDLMKRSGYDRVVQVWDFASGACLSGQLYSDSYSCSVATRHPHANAFLVQSNGGYICAYYEERPYRRIKSKVRATHHSFFVVSNIYALQSRIFVVMGLLNIP
jgi:hypothetical protein